MYTSIRTARPTSLKPTPKIHLYPMHFPASFPDSGRVDTYT